MFRHQQPNHIPEAAWDNICPNIRAEWCTTGIAFIRVEFGHNADTCPDLTAVSHELTPTIAQAFGGKAYHMGYPRDTVSVIKHGILPMEREASQACSFVHWDRRCKNQQRTGASSGRDLVWSFDAVAAATDAFDKGCSAHLHGTGTYSFTGAVSMQKHCRRVTLYDCAKDKHIDPIFCSEFKNMIFVAVMVDAGGSTLAANILHHFQTINNTDVFEDMLYLDCGGLFWQCPECSGKNTSCCFLCIFCTALAIYYDPVTKLPISQTVHAVHEVAMEMLVVPSPPARLDLALPTRANAILQIPS